MKFLFVVQGEGRGHFTQALSMKQLLESNGHTVIAVAVGRSSARRVPRFFTDRIGAPVATFASPNFLPSGRRARLLPSIIFNLLRLPEYASSVLWLRRTIDTCGADTVINFYELLTGLTYRLLQPRVPYVCVGHQYMLLHERFAVPQPSAGLTACGSPGLRPKQTPSIRPSSTILSSGVTRRNLPQTSLSGTCEMLPCCIDTITPNRPSLMSVAALVP